MCGSLFGMISFTEIRDVPFIGQTVHFFPNPKEKFAAIVVEVHPLSRDDGQTLQRPKVNLFVLEPNGEETAHVEVEPLNIENPDAVVKDQWCFVNEFATLQSSDLTDEELPGTKSNHHVGADLGL